MKKNQVKSHKIPSHSLCDSVGDQENDHDAQRNETNGTRKIRALTAVIPTSCDVIRDDVWTSDNELIRWQTEIRPKWIRLSRNNSWNRFKACCYFSSAFLMSHTKYSSMTHKKWLINCRKSKKKTRKFDTKLGCVIKLVDRICYVMLYVM